MASAGSGKTTFILKEIERLASEGAIKNKYGALVLVFSLSARDDFRCRLAQFKDIICHSQVMTFHCLAGKLSGSASRSVEFVIWKTTEDLERKSCPGIQTKACTKKVRHIFVDEAQDLSPIQLKFV